MYKLKYYLRKLVSTTVKKYKIIFNDLYFFTAMKRIGRKEIKLKYIIVTYNNRWCNGGRDKKNSIITIIV